MSIAKFPDTQVRLLVLSLLRQHRDDGLKPYVTVLSDDQCLLMLFAYKISF
jgi:hypothetical protein